MTAMERRKRLNELPISNRARNVLANADCWSEHDVAEKMTKQKLGSEPRSGPSLVREVEDMLASLGLELRDEFSQEDRIAALRKKEVSLAKQLDKVRREIADLTRDLPSSKPKTPP